MWIKRIRVILSTNGRLTCGNEDKKGISEKRKEHLLFFLGMEFGSGGTNRFYREKVQLLSKFPSDQTVEHYKKNRN